MTHFNELTFNFLLPETKLDPWVVYTHSPQGSNTGKTPSTTSLCRLRALPCKGAPRPTDTGGRRGLASHFCDPRQNTCAGCCWLFQSGLWNKDPEPDMEVCCCKRQRFWGFPRAAGTQRARSSCSAVGLEDRTGQSPPALLCLPVHPPASPHTRHSSTARPPDSVKGRGWGGAELSFASSLCLCFAGFTRNAPSL